MQKGPGTPERTDQNQELRVVRTLKGRTGMHVLLSFHRPVYLLCFVYEKNMIGLEILSQSLSVIFFNYHVSLKD